MATCGGVGLSIYGSNSSCRRWDFLSNILYPRAYDAVRYQIWVALDKVQRVRRRENLFLACVFVSKP